MRIILEKIKLYWPLILLTLYVGLFYLVFINLFNSDIGRHLANGRQFFTGTLTEFKALLSTNFYSFSQTNFPNTNHHWLYGVVVYAVYYIGGFKLLTYLNALTNTLAFIFIMMTCLNLVGNKNKTGIFITTIVGFLTLPLLTHRLEVRPESLSLLFFSIYYFIFNSKKIINNKWYLVFILATQIIWVNIHLFFILGPLLVGYFLFQKTLELLFNKKSLMQIFKNKSFKFWLSLCLSLFFISLLNPNLIKGIMQPFNIFNNYAYTVAENQSTLFMINYGSQIMFYSFVIFISLMAIIAATLELRNKKNKLSVNISQLILVCTFAFLANKINRMTPFLAVIITPFLVKSFFDLYEDLKKKYKKQFEKSIATLLTSSILMIVVLTSLSFGFFTPRIEALGAGLFPNSFVASNFFKENKLTGPIFNNYDIGGYLAFNLFPQEKLFIDNRPEAYSSEFIKDEFLASLQDENTWKTINQKYNFNVIFFNRHDAIDGAQQFLSNRVKDENWIPVFVDEFTIIFVKNNNKNKEIISKYQIPQENFVLNY